MKRAMMLGMVVVGVAGLAWVGVGAAPAEEGSAKAPGVVSIDMPKYVAELPPAEGRDAFARDCMICHTASYINMQPPLSEAKWEAEATKMAKTYAAPVPAADVKSIAEYIVAVKEKGPGFTIGRAVVPQGDVPAWLVEACSKKAADQAGQGAAVFAKSCASCHGAAGMGDGASAKTQFPPATNLTDRVFAPEALAADLWNGVPGAAMPSYRFIPEDQLKPLAAYVASLGRSDAERPDVTAGAKEIYVNQCARCHGVDGGGNGQVAGELARRPADFRQKQLTLAAAEKAITDGVPGTAMPSWKAKLSAEQTKELAAYVGAFFGK